MNSFMKRILALVLTLFSLPTFASGNKFTWIAPMAHHFEVPEHVLTFSLVVSLLILGAIIYRSILSKVNDVVIPDKGFTFRNLVEAYGQFMYNQCKAVIGEDRAPTYFPFIATIFILILTSNLIGLIPGFLPPTEHLSTTLALGLLSFIYYNIAGARAIGTFNYLKHFAGPLWYMAVLVFPIEIISNIVRPISLALRLRGNMFGDHLVLSIFSDLVPLLIPTVFMVLGLLVCFLQAYVFTVLSMVYISLATAHHDHGEHAHGEHAHH